MSNNELDSVYNERDRLISLLTTFYLSYLSKDETSEEGFKTVVYIETPEGQLSWHISDKEVQLFKHLKYEDNKWDGHTTEEKYKRIEKLIKLNNKINGSNWEEAIQRLKDFANETQLL